MSVNGPPRDDYESKEKYKKAPSLHVLRGQNRGSTISLG